MMSLLGVSSYGSAILYTPAEGMEQPWCPRMRTFSYPADNQPTAVLSNLPNKFLRYTTLTAASRIHFLYARLYSTLWVRASPTTSTSDLLQSHGKAVFGRNKYNGTSVFLDDHATIRPYIPFRQSKVTSRIRRRTPSLIYNHRDP
jgi:hypothetical protein